MRSQSPTSHGSTGESRIGVHGGIPPGSRYVGVGVIVGVAVGLAVGVTVAEGIGVAAGVGVGAGLAVGVIVAVGVGVVAEVNVAVGSAAGVGELHAASMNTQKDAMRAVRASMEGTARQASCAAVHGWYQPCPSDVAWTAGA